MKNPTLNLFLSPRGRIARKTFAIALAALAVFLIAQHYGFEALGTGAANFYIAPIFFFLNLHIIFCIYGKRLHDIGRSSWPLIAMFAILIVAAIIAMLAFGGLEYFEGAMDPKINQDAAAMQALHDTYQAKLAANTLTIAVMLYVIPALFTLWLLAAPGHKDDNRYGPPAV